MFLGVGRFLDECTLRLCFFVDLIKKQKLLRSSGPFSRAPNYAWAWCAIGFLKNSKVALDQGLLKEKKTGLSQISATKNSPSLTSFQQAKRYFEGLGKST